MFSAEEDEVSKRNKEEEARDSRRIGTEVVGDVEKALRKPERAVLGVEKEG